MIKVAILYICTGKYNQFFPVFYQSAKKYLLKGVADVEFFVFTDGEISPAPDIHTYYKEYEGYPKDSLHRFDLFLSIEKELLSFDYAYFFNSNMEFVDEVGSEIFPEKEGLAAVLHPGFYSKPIWWYPYERNRKSTAYIPSRQGNYHYYMGSFNGGKVTDYLQLAKVCSECVHEDEKHGITAYVDDESHLNKYLRNHPCKAISPAYAYPEGKKLPFNPKIILLNKAKFSSSFDLDKFRDFSLMGRVKKGFRILWRGIIWYL